LLEYSHNYRSNIDRSRSLNACLLKVAPIVWSKNVVTNFKPKPHNILEECSPHTYKSYLNQCYTWPNVKCPQCGNLRSHPGCLKWNWEKKTVMKKDLHKLCDDCRSLNKSDKCFLQFCVLWLVKSCEGYLALELKACNVTMDRSGGSWRLSTRTMCRDLENRKRKVVIWVKEDSESFREALYEDTRWKVRHRRKTYARKETLKMQVSRPAPLHCLWPQFCERPCSLFSIPNGLRRTLSSLGTNQ
jgi:hypothetical protein